MEELVRQAVDDGISAHGGLPKVAVSVVEPVTMMGDRELLRRAVENVIRTALCYSLSGSEVHVSLRPTSKATIDVRDFGPGVPKESLPKTFQPFFSVSDSRSTVTGGKGLGLAIAMRAVRLHLGARCRYGSKNIGGECSDAALSREVVAHKGNPADLRWFTHTVTGAR